MEYSLFTKLAAEFFGTAILMIFGNGSVANVELKNTKGHHAGWLNIAMGYGFGVMFPVLMFGGVSGAHINPAMTLAQAINGLFPWSDVLPYIVAQLLGALLGQFIVYLTYYPHYKETEDAEAILGTFCTTDADNDKIIQFKAQVDRLAHQLGVSVRDARPSSANTMKPSAGKHPSTITVGTLLRDDERNAHSADRLMDPDDTIDPDHTGSSNIASANAAMESDSTASGRIASARCLIFRRFPRPPSHWTVWMTKPMTRRCRPTETR